MFITLLTISCSFQPSHCKRYEQDKEIAVNSKEISQLIESPYHWRKDGILHDNGRFEPNKSAIEHKGCMIFIKDRQLPYFTEFPCKTYVLPKLKG